MEPGEKRLVSGSGSGDALITSGLEKRGSPPDFLDRRARLRSPWNVRQTSETPGSPGEPAANPGFDGTGGVALFASVRTGVKAEGPPLRVSVGRMPEVTSNARTPSTPHRRTSALGVRCFTGVLIEERASFGGGRRSPFPPRRRPMLRVLREVLVSLRQPGELLNRWP